MTNVLWLRRRWERQKLERVDVRTTNSEQALAAPGSLTTNGALKQAGPPVDAGDRLFREVVGDIQQRLLALAGVSERDYTAVLLPGSGTLGIESVVGSTIPHQGKLLVIINGPAGQHIAYISAMLQIERVLLKYAEDSLPDLDQIAETLASDDSISHVAVVQREAASGLINPVAKIGAIVRRYGRRFIVDAVGSFGVQPLNLKTRGIDYLIASSDHGVEGVPGCSFVLARKAALAATEGCSRSLNLDLFAQWRSFEEHGKFRLTPPINTLLAFQQALHRQSPLRGGTR